MKFQPIFRYSRPLLSLWDGHLTTLDLWESLPTPPESPGGPSGPPDGPFYPSQTSGWALRTCRRASRPLSAAGRASRTLPDQREGLQSPPVPLGGPPDAP